MSCNRLDVLTIASREITSDSLPNRLQPNPVLSLHSSIIQPGEVLTIPLIIAPARTGELDLLALALFASAEDENDIGTAALAHPLFISPLLHVEAQPRFARSGPKTYIVSLEILNASTATVKIENIQSLSAYWTGSKETDTATLLPNQTLRVQRHVQAAEGQIDLGQTDLVNSLSKLVQGQTDISQDPAPGPITLKGDFAAKDLEAYLASRQHFRLDQLQRTFPTIPLPTLAHMAPLLDPLDLDFAVSWFIECAPPRLGTSYLHGVRVSPEYSAVEKIRREIDEAISKGGKTTRTMYEETGRLRQVLMDSVLNGVLGQEDDPVELKVVAGKGSAGGKKAEVIMEKGGIVNIAFQLKNRSPMLSVRWVLDLPRPGSGETLFGGMMSLRGTLHPGESENVATIIRVEEPGMTRITGWTLRTETGDGVPEVDDEEEGRRGETGDNKEEWSPRRSWSRGDQGEWIEVVSAV